MAVQHAIDEPKRRHQKHHHHHHHHHHLGHSRQPPASLLVSNNNKNKGYNNSSGKQQLLGANMMAASPLRALAIALEEGRESIDEKRMRNWYGRRGGIEGGAQRHGFNLIKHSSGW